MVERRSVDGHASIGCARGTSSSVRALRHRRVDRAARRRARSRRNVSAAIDTAAASTTDSAPSAVRRSCRPGRCPGTVRGPEGRRRPKPAGSTLPRPANVDRPRSAPSLRHRRSQPPTPPAQAGSARSSGPWCDPADFERRLVKLSALELADPRPQSLADRLDHDVPLRMPLKKGVAGWSVNEANITDGCAETEEHGRRHRVAALVHGHLAAIWRTRDLRRFGRYVLAEPSPSYTPAAQASSVVFTPRISAGP